MGLVALCGAALSFAQAAAAEAPAKEKGDHELFNELEKGFYQTPKSTESQETHLRQLERRAETLLLGHGRETEIQQFRESSIEDIRTLARNYAEAAKNVSLQDKTLAFRTQLMCKDYAEAFRNLARGDLREARLAMKRARDRRDDLRAVFIE
jgi:hypothetical protein